MESFNLESLLDECDSYDVMECYDAENVNSENVCSNTDDRKLNLNYMDSESMHINSMNNNNMSKLKSYYSFSSNEIYKSTENEKKLKYYGEDSIRNNFFNMKYKDEKNEKYKNFNLSNSLHKLKHCSIPLLYNSNSPYNSRNNISTNNDVNGTSIKNKENFMNTKRDIIPNSNTHLNKLEPFPDNIISNYVTVKSFQPSKAPIYDYSSSYYSSTSSPSTSSSSTSSSSTSFTSSYEQDSYRSTNSNVPKKKKIKFFDFLSFKDTNEEGSVKDTFGEYYMQNKKRNYLLPKKRKKKGKRKKSKFFYGILKTIKELCNEIFIRSFQTMVSYFITTSFFTILNLYVSNTCDYYEIAGFGVAISVNTVLSSIIDGILNSIDFFCSYSIGIGNIDFSWLILNCVYFMFLIICLFLFIILFLFKVLVYVLLNYILCNITSEYVVMFKVFSSTLQILLISFLPLLLFESTRRFLILHNNIFPSLLTATISFFLLNLFCYIFVFKLHLQYIGASISILLVNIINLFFILFFLKLHIEKCKSSIKKEYLFETKEDPQKKNNLFKNNDNYKYRNKVLYIDGNIINKKVLKVEEQQVEELKTEVEEYKDSLDEKTMIYSDQNIKNYNKSNKDRDIDINNNNKDNDNNNIFSINNDYLREPYIGKNTFINIKNPRIYNFYFLFCNIPSDEIIKNFLYVTKTNIKNLFFEILAFEFQLFESTYLCLTSTAAFVQITNFLNLVYYVSGSYGIVLSKITGIYTSSKHTKTKKKKLSEIILAFILILSFLYFCLILMYIYHKNIILFFYSDIQLQKKLMKIFPLLIAELLFEALASLLNSIIKGIGLQHEISFFTFFNFMFLMHPLGLILSFYVKLNIYGFIYSNLISMIIQVIYLISFLTNKICKKQIFH